MGLFLLPALQFGGAARLCAALLAAVALFTAFAEKPRRWSAALFAAVALVFAGASLRVAPQSILRSSPFALLRGEAARSGEDRAERRRPLDLRGGRDRGCGALRIPGHKRAVVVGHGGNPAKGLASSRHRVCRARPSGPPALREASAVGQLEEPPCP
jgi:hypothetical protein